MSATDPAVLTIDVVVLKTYRGTCSECGLVTYTLPDPELAQVRVAEHRAWHEREWLRENCTCSPTPNDGRWDDPDCPVH